MDTFCSWFSCSAVALYWRHLRHFRYFRSLHSKCWHYLLYPAECSPESRVSTAESDSSNSLPAPEPCRTCLCQEEPPLQLTTRSDDVSDEFYNLTKLAEVSLAAAAGQLFHRRFYQSRDEDYEVGAECPEAAKWRGLRLNDHSFLPYFCCGWGCKYFIHLLHKTNIFDGKKYIDCYFLFERKREECHR